MISNVGRYTTKEALIVVPEDLSAAFRKVVLDFVVAMLKEAP